MNDARKADVRLPEMIDIPAGTFLMGSPAAEPGRCDDEAQHEVAVAPFRIARFAVTFEEFDVFVKETGRRVPKDFGWGRGRRPVVDVSWRDAMAYCAWLSQKTGQHYRLPTEAEWEYAARAGTTTAYWWGDEADPTRAHYWKGDGTDGTAPVDSYEPNPWGLYNMLGNTWEWTSSTYQTQWDGSEQRCAGEEQDGPRVVRGGCLLNTAANLHSARRERYEPDIRNDYIGFRLSQYP